MTEPLHAVFLSYASQDAQAAQKICEALRAAGIEVWLDQSKQVGLPVPRGGSVANMTRFATPRAAAPGHRAAIEVSQLR